MDVSGPLSQNNPLYTTYFNYFHEKIKQIIYLEIIWLNKLIKFKINLIKSILNNNFL
jgi:hypothetical protein